MMFNDGDWRGKIQIEKELKRNEIIRNIKALEKAIGLIEMGETARVESVEPYKPHSHFLYNDPKFEDWEMRLIIERKKRKIKELKKELEAI